MADKNFVDQAKQLFASVYFNANWQGDYMLLAHEISEDDLKWFKDKGILIKKCPAVYDDKIGTQKGVVLSKLYLFQKEFKEWKNIIFLDADILVRASLDDLTKVNGLMATSVAYDTRLKNQFTDDGKLLKEIYKNKYKLNGITFNTGVFAFSTSIITDDTYDKLLGLFKKFRDVLNYGEEGVLNLFFYKRWKKMPIIYNLWPFYLNKYCRIKPNKVKGIILHFIAEEKPWEEKSYFYREWENNLKKADLIKVNKIDGRRWNKVKITITSAYLNIKLIPHKINMHLGLAGLYLKKKLPWLYYSIRPRSANITKRIDINLGKKCNLSCPFCYYLSSTRENNFSYESIVINLKKYKKEGITKYKALDIFSLVNDFLFEISNNINTPNKAAITPPLT